MVAHAVGLLNWHRRHRFCANCGTPTVAREAGHVRVCPACGAQHHPRTDPVVMITTGSVRGWCAAPHAGHGAGVAGLRHRGRRAAARAERWRRCQFSSAAAWASRPPAACDSAGATSRSPRNGAGRSAAPADPAHRRRRAPAPSTPSSTARPLAELGRRELPRAASPSCTTSTPVGARHHGARRGVRAALAQPHGVAAPGRGSVQAAPGEGVRRRQPAASRSRPCARSAPARARRSPRAP